MSKYLAGIIVITLLAFLSCKEEDKESVNVVKHLIDYEDDTSFISSNNFVPDARNVLLQEFTGVYCYTCPLAHEITSSINSRFPGRVIPMNVHSHLFSIYDDPRVMGNKYDFRTKAGDSIVSMLGGINSLPSAAFNMTLQDGEQLILSSDRSKWESYFQSELDKKTKVNIEAVSKYDSETRKLKIVTKYTVLEPLSGTLNYSIAITENDIIDKQFVDTAVVNDYKHNFILRDVISSSAKGTFLSEIPSKGEVYVIVHNIKIPEEWNIKNLNIVTYAHDNKQNYTVYQADLIDL